MARTHFRGCCTATGSRARCRLSVSAHLQRLGAGFGVLLQLPAEHAASRIYVVRTVVHSALFTHGPSSPGASVPGCRPQLLVQHPRSSEAAARPAGGGGAATLQQQGSFYTEADLHIGAVLNVSGPDR
jgi:hypothetical protein